MTKPKPMNGGILGRPSRRKDASTSSSIPLRLESHLLGYRAPLPSGEPPVDRGPPPPDLTRPSAAVYGGGADPKHLRWDPTKQAFRLINPPTRCNCGNHKSALPGERLTCGLCAGRATLPRRFQPGVDVRREPTCGYCGELTGNKTRICDECQQIKERLIASGITGDDQILVGVHRALAATARRTRREDEIEEVRSKRNANRRRVESRREQVAA
jgi:hypothetical protein